MSDADTIKRLTAKKFLLTKKAKAIGFTIKMVKAGPSYSFTVGPAKAKEDDRYWYDDLDQIEAFLHGVYLGKNRKWIS